MDDHREHAGRLLREAFPTGSVTLLDVDNVVPGDLMVVLADLQADTDHPYRWLEVYQRWDNGWFEVLSTEAGGVSYSTPNDTPLATVSGDAPIGATHCEVTLLGTTRTRAIHGGYFVAGFAFDRAVVPDQPQVAFLS